MAADLATPILVLAGTVFSGVGLEIVRRLLGRAKEKDDTATEFRKELRGELSSIKSELDTVEKELDEWKGKYYDLLQQYIDVKGQLEDAIRKAAKIQNGKA